MKTCILLSTFNGERFIPEQIQSIRDQTQLPDMVIIRDDGSTDNTVEIAAQLLNDHHIKFELHIGENIGPEKSFRAMFDLGIKTDADLFFFCDQDDIWLPEKIATLCEEFTPDGSPQLVFSGYLLVDESNKLIGRSTIPKKIGFGNAVLQNIVTGCTSACNRACLKLAAKGKIDTPIMHDRWLYLISTALGSARFINSQTIRYRQHGGNVVGAERSAWKVAIKRIRRFISKGRTTQRSAIRQILEHHAIEMAPKDVKLCEDLLSAKNSFAIRLKLVFSRQCWRQRPLDELLWRILLLAGRI